ncbi:hypothetical protein ACQR0Z_22910 [Bradyrhizobium sp. HKCCYLS3077]|uniref:hypothetical protein n=1 Tax=Bradyrhizobium sp. HKCCYLS3077 TaxID=3420761 RepID=UPI003EB9BEC3
MMSIHPAFANHYPIDSRLVLDFAETLPALIAQDLFEQYLVAWGVLISTAYSLGIKQAAKVSLSEFDGMEQELFDYMKSRLPIIAYYRPTWVFEFSKSECAPLRLSRISRSTLH